MTDADATDPTTAVDTETSPESTATRDRMTRWRLVLGGSMGGMRVLEWAVTTPDRVDTALVLASTAYATAEQIGWCQAQLLAIRADSD